MRRQQAEGAAQGFNDDLFEEFHPFGVEALAECLFGNRTSGEQADLDRDLAEGAVTTGDAREEGFDENGRR